MVATLRASGGQLPAVLGMPVAGLLWSFATLHARADLVSSAGLSPEHAVLLISLGGLTQTLALWVGFTTVLWAMIRGLGGHLPLLRMATLVSNAALPFWIGAPMAAYWLHGFLPGNMLPAGVLLASLVLFTQGLARLMSMDLGWSLTRSTFALAAALVFLASFTFLSL